MCRCFCRGWSAPVNADYPATVRVGRDMRRHCKLLRDGTGLAGQVHDVNLRVVADGGARLPPCSCTPVPWCGSHSKHGHGFISL